MYCVFRHQIIVYQDLHRIVPVFYIGNPVSKSIFNFLFHAMNREYLWRTTLNWCRTLHSVMTQWFIELKWSSIYKVHLKLNGLKMSLEIEVSNPMFWTTSALSFYLQTAVTSNVLIDNENHESAFLLLSHVLNWYILYRGYKEKYIDNIWKTNVNIWKAYVKYETSSITVHKVLTWVSYGIKKRKKERTRNMRKPH